MTGLELWGGHECTVNRVGTAFHDQTRLTGHHDRIDDLDRFAELGVKALRYPVLWERTAPEHPDKLDFEWSDARLERMQHLGLRPILGLVHHGGGPAYTSLVEESFASGLAAFAGQVARRYPQVRDWTPVNEPLTTARFSCLYGHWYPHLRDESMFWTALLNQVDAVRLSMRQIRLINPEARLIQTEDFGRTYATRAVAQQARFDNERRWMTWDLLFGKVTADHFFWDRLVGMGLGDRLRAIADDPCPPQVIGINHYLTSDRFLDHRCERFPPERCGGNDVTPYADVEAVRVMSPGPGGLDGALQEVADRYGTTLAITECHNGCTREDQMRWLREAWDSANAFRDRGGDLEAVTAWSLLGAYDWNSLITRPTGHYECGAFDVSGGAPRATATTSLLKSLATGRGSHPPVAHGAGWWRRDVRLQYSPVFRSIDDPEPRSLWRAQGGPTPPILIAGATGTLGRAVARACEWRGLDYVLTGRRDLDLADTASLERALDRHSPWVVVNAIGFVRVDEAEADQASCFAANAEGAADLAAACARRGIGFVSFSTDLVFDGQAQRPYVETDPVGPLNAYGASKAAAERQVLQAHPEALMIRTAAFFSPYDPYNFAAHILRDLAAGSPVTAADDLIVSPTYVPDLVDAALDLALDGERGIWHLANSGAVSWAGFAKLIAEAFGYDPALIKGRPAADFGWPAERPAFAALASARGAIMPPLGSAIARFATTLRAADPPPAGGNGIQLVSSPAAPTTARARARVSAGERPVL